MKLFDVSKWQKGINLREAENFGYQGVILRTGYGVKKDECFSNFIKQLSGTPMWVGFYHYCVGNSYNSGFEQGKLAAQCALESGVDCTTIYCDLEKRLKVKEHTQLLSGFIDGLYHVHPKYVPGVYSSEYDFNKFFDKDFLVNKKLPIWVAKYSYNRPHIGIPYNIWQYTSSPDTTDFYKLGLDRSIVIDPEVVIPGESEITHDNLEEVALSVVRGAYGNGDRRAIAISDAGYDYVSVQSIVNKYYSIAMDIMMGKYGNNPERKKKLEAKGINYNLAQDFVNAIYYY